MVVEEAGQVLEAHILSTLMPSVEHLVMIGDPKQLRPTISNYREFENCFESICVSISNITDISMDSKKGSTFYKFDRSLMERLSDNGFPMSCINVQRRMRPSISSLIRYVSIRLFWLTPSLNTTDYTNQEYLVPTTSRSWISKTISSYSRIWSRRIFPNPYVQRKWKRKWVYK